MKKRKTLRKIAQAPKRSGPKVICEKERQSEIRGERARGKERERRKERLKERQSG